VRVCVCVCTKRVCVSVSINGLGWVSTGMERDIIGRKPKSCLGCVFNFRLGSLTDNTINPLNANDQF